MTILSFCPFVCQCVSFTDFEAFAHLTSGELVYKSQRHYVFWNFMRIQGVEETLQFVSWLNATTNFSFTWASYEFTKSNGTSLHWWLSTGKSARHTGRRKKLQVTLAEGRDPDDSVEINREKEHPSLGNQASSAVLLKQQCVPCRKKTPTCFHKPICLKLSRTWYVS